ncbi:hypothetical protein AAG906_035063 [Vitis piasezkii]
MLNVIISSGLEDLIDDTRSCPEKNLHRSMVVNLEDTLWQRQNRLLMGWIYSTLTESIMSQIIGITTAQSVWNSLERMSTAINRARLMELRFMLQTTKKGNMKMMDYILTIQGIIGNLAVIGRLDQQNSINDNNLIQVKTATYHSSNRKKRKFQQPFYGHFHQSYDCCHRFDNNYSSLRNSQMIVLATPNITADNYNSWYMDSGATHHITHDLTSLNNTNPFSGADKVLVLLQCQLDRGLYKVSSSDSTAFSSGPLFCISINPYAFIVWKKNCRLWHSYLGHLVDPIVSRVLQLFNEPPIISNLVCETCQTAKSHRLPFVVSNSRAIKSFSLVHIDLWVLLQ